VYNCVCWEWCMCMLSVCVCGVCVCVVVCVVWVWLFKNSYLHSLESMSDQMDLELQTVLNGLLW